MNENNGQNMPVMEDGSKVVIAITVNDRGQFEMKSTLNPPMVNWVLDGIKVGLLMQNQAEPSPIVQPKGGIMNFSRRRKK